MNRELDIEIAEKVFGYKVEERTKWLYDDAWGDYPVKQWQMLVKYHPKEMKPDMNGEVWEDPAWEEWEVLPKYSTDLKDAWKIITHFQAFAVIDLGTVTGNWFCRIATRNSPWDDKIVEETSTDVATAICGAALKSVGK